METAGSENQGKVAVPSAATPVRSTDTSKPKRARRTRWNNDGPTEEVSSLSVLLDWLTTAGNYARWRGDDSHSGETKAALASQITTLIEAKDITTDSKVKDIINKVGQLEQSFREAVNFLSNTGAGITDETSLRAAIERRCPHYEVLKDAFGDRQSTRSLLTSDGVSLFGDEDDENHEQDAEEWSVPDLTIDTAERPAKRQRANHQSRPRPGSIRTRSPSATSTVSEWSDLSLALSHAKKMDRESKTYMHAEQMD